VRTPPLDPFDDITANIHEVAHHRAAGGEPPGALSVKHGGADGIPGDVDGIVDPLHRGEEVMGREHGRMDPQLHLIPIPFPDGKQLDAIAELRAILDIEGGDGRYPLDKDVVEVHPDPEGQGGQDGELMGGISPLHVEGGVGLGIAQALGILEHLAKPFLFLGHPGQDVVGGPVQDREDRDDPVGHQPFSEGADDGDAPAHACLKADPYPVCLGSVKDLSPVEGQEGLVGRYHVFARFHRLQNKGARRLNAAYEFHADGDLGVREHCLGISGQDLLRHLHLSMPRQVYVGDPVQADPPSQALLYQGGVLLQYPHHPCAHGAESDKPYLDLLHFCSSFLIPRTACLMRCSFSTRARRTYPSPHSPKPMPGETATLASLKRNLENSREPIFLKAGGISAQTNMVALGFATSQPARLRPSTRMSRRDW